MQKTYTADFLTKKMAENNGEKDQYYVQGNHEEIIDPDDWEAAQCEIKRREDCLKTHGIRKISSKTGTAFFNRVFCAGSGCRLQRRNRKGSRPFWKCLNERGQTGTPAKPRT